LLPHIELTTIRQDVPGQARAAVRSAIDRIESPDAEPHEIVLDPELVVRGTTQPSLPA
jgi:DNA-binding LacI/PurR family transcriptional regulator